MPANSLTAANDQVTELKKLDLPSVIRQLDALSPELRQSLALEQEAFSTSEPDAELPSELAELYSSIQQLPNALMVLKEFNDALVAYANWAVQAQEQREKILVKNELVPAMHAVVAYILAPDRDSINMQDALNAGKESSELGSAAEFLLFEFIKDGLHFKGDAVQRYRSGDKSQIETYVRQYADWLTGSVNLKLFSNKQR